VEMARVTVEMAGVTVNIRTPERLVMIPQPSSSISSMTFSTAFAASYA
jgi:hypothetical protein